MAIRLATTQDVPSLMELESRNYIGNLDASDLGDGFISILHPEQWFASAVASRGVHVATGDDGTVVGFMAITPPPSSSTTESSPIIQAMMELSETLVFDGRPIAQQRFAFRGPVLIDRSARGHGIYSEFNSIMHEAHVGDFDIGVLFVAAENVRSVHTTTTKLGAESLTIFDVNGRKYHFMAFKF